MKTVPWCVCMALLALPLRADVPVLWAGFLEDADGPVDRTVTAVFSIHDGDDALLATHTEIALVVVAGELVVDLVVPERDDLKVEVAINGTILGPRTPLPISLPATARALTADQTPRALTALSVGAITSPVTANALAQPGGPAIPFANIQGFPAEFLDGDDGLVFTGGDTISFVNGVVSIKSTSLTDAHLSGTLASADLADEGIETDDLANGGVNASDLSNLPVEKIAAGTLQANAFGGGTRPTLFAVTEPGCSETLNTVSTVSTCTFTNTGTCVAFVINGTPVNGAVNCLGQCVVGSTSPCPNTAIGVLVFP